MIANLEHLSDWKQNACDRTTHLNQLIMYQTIKETHLFDTSKNVCSGTARHNKLAQVEILQLLTNPTIILPKLLKFDLNLRI